MVDGSSAPGLPTNANAKYCGPAVNASQIAVSDTGYLVFLGYGAFSSSCYFNVSYPAGNRLELEVTSLLDGQSRAVVVDNTGTYDPVQLPGVSGVTTTTTLTYYGGTTLQVSLASGGAPTGAGVVVQYRVLPIPANIFVCDGQSPGTGTDRVLHVDLASEGTGTVFMPAYAANSFCMWNFTVPAGQMVRFTVNRFYTERNYDVLRFVQPVLGADISLLLQLSGNAEEVNATAGITAFAGNTYDVQGGFFAAIFTADDVFEFAGFNMTYVLVPDSNPPSSTLEYAPMQFCTFGNVNPVFNGSAGDRGFFFMPSFNYRLSCR